MNGATTMDRRRPSLIIATLSLSLFVVASTAAEAGSKASTWSVGDPCTGHQQRVYAENADRVKAAEPEDDAYLPHPFPKTAEQAFEDFVFYHRRAATGRTTSSGSGGERGLLTVLEGGDAPYRVTRVANWTPTRCGRHEERAFFWLFRIFDGEEEVTRVAVSPSGMVASVVHWADGPFAGSPPPLPADPRTSIDGASNGRDFQYVSTWGTLRCDMLIPCVAYRQGDEVRLHWSNPLRKEARLYAIAHDSERFSVEREMATPEQKDEFLQRFAGGDRRIVSLGGDALAVASPIER